MNFFIPEFYRFLISKIRYLNTKDSKCPNLIPAIAMFRQNKKLGRLLPSDRSCRSMYFPRIQVAVAI